MVSRRTDSRDFFFRHRLGADQSLCEQGFKAGDLLHQSLVLHGTQAQFQLRLPKRLLGILQSAGKLALESQLFQLRIEAGLNNSLLLHGVFRIDDPSVQLRDHIARLDMVPDLDMNAGDARRLQGSDTFHNPLRSAGHHPILAAAGIEEGGEKDEKHKHQQRPESTDALPPGTAIPGHMDGLILLGHGF